MSRTGRAGARVLVAAVVLLVAVVLVGRHGELAGTGRALRDSSPAWAAAACGLGLLSMVTFGAEQVAAQRALAVRLSVTEVIWAAQAARFLNLVAKSGGLAGVVAHTAVARRRGRRPSPVVAAYVASVLLDILAFASVLVAGLLLLLTHGHFTARDGAAAAAFAVYLLVSFVAVAAAARSRETARSLLTLPVRLAARVPGLRRWARGRSTEVAHEHADELYEAVIVLRARPRRLGGAAIFALAFQALLVAQLWAVLRAVGVAPGIVVPIVAFAISTLFGIVGVVPGGVGFVEVSLGAVLATFGVPVATAAAVVLLFRLFEFWLPLAVGAVAAHQIAVGAVSGVGERAER